jgi:hypothetical protein
MTLLFWFARSYCAYLTFFIEIMWFQFKYFVAMTGPRNWRGR